MTNLAARVKPQFEFLRRYFVPFLLAGIINAMAQSRVESLSFVFTFLQIIGLAFGCRAFMDWGKRKT